MIDNTFMLFGDKGQLEIPPEERRMLENHSLTRITDMMFNVSSEDGRGGLPVCINQFGNNLYIGFTQGVIRIFDLNACEELKCLLPKKQKSAVNKVTCLDISVTGGQLVAGYASGKICVFDLVKQKIIVETDDIYKSEVDTVKFLSNLSTNHIVATDSKGNLRKIVVTKGLLK